jgi:hypothetical protein
LAARAGWPSGIPLRPVPQGVTLVLALHPMCPCSRATIGELSRLMTNDHVQAYVLFVRPTGVPIGWEHTDLWDAAAAIPGVTVMADEQGAWSGRFGALTSGQTYAYDASGQLLFSGGITAARGHMGDNAGSDAIIRILCGRSRDATAFTSAPVFGCPLGVERCEPSALAPGAQSSVRSEP